MTFQLQVFDYLRKQRAGAARQGRATKAGMKFFGDARAADNRATLQHERLESSFREIECGDQAVVSGADDDDFMIHHAHDLTQPEPGLMGQLATANVRLLLPV